jgi:hypothetical protein
MPRHLRRDGVVRPVQRERVHLLRQVAKRERVPWGVAESRDTEVVRDGHGRARARGVEVDA